jgi:DNA repair exonuclease SbcCD ATPase subunit
MVDVGEGSSESAEDMLVRSLLLEGFMNHGRTELELPDRGVTAIAGDNGQGKSSIIEAVSFSGWGKTLRGTSPWQDGRKGKVRLVTDQVETQSTVTAKGTAKLTWMAAGEEKARKFDRQTDAKKALAGEVGEHDLWRRTHVFSSADAAHFSGATNMQRNQLIELVLGMDVFDRALEACRADRAMVKEKCSRVALESAAVTGEYRAVKLLLDNWQEPAPFEEEPPPAKPEVEARSELLPALESEMVELEEVQAAASVRATVTMPEALVVANSEARSMLVYAERRWVAVNAGKCGECDRPFEQADLEAAQRAVDLAQEHASACSQAEAAERREVATARQNALNEVAAIKEQQQKVRTDIGRVTQVLDAVARYDRDKAAWGLRQADRRKRYEATAQEQRARLKKARDALTEHAAQLDELDELRDELQLELDELVTTEKVLPKIRTQVLAHALEGIEYVANGWLGRMAPGVEIALRPYTETKTAGVNDQLSLVVEGVGGGHGFKATSGGERRRIDAAIILGLAEVAAAAKGQADGTLFFDEVFDALDASGCAAVAECLMELGKRRAVVVITHRWELAGRLDVDRRYVAKDGALEEA